MKFLIFNIALYFSILVSAGYVENVSALEYNSSLWGNDGENFDPAGRLMDWSYAGYHAGEIEPPKDTDCSVDIQIGDDTTAILAAIDSLKNSGGVVCFPNGEFTIEQRLVIPSGVVIRGEGRSTILNFPKSLSEIDGIADPGKKYSFGDAYIKARGFLSSSIVAKVKANAKRGDRNIIVSSTQRMEVGMWIRLRQKDDGSGSMMKRLHADLMDGGEDNKGDSWDFATRVLKIVSANEIQIERSLPLDIDTAWNPKLFVFKSTVSEVGVENLTIQFPHTTYEGHFTEKGYNAIEFRGLINSYVRNVTITNADYGLSLNGCFFVTAENVWLDNTSPRGRYDGHHGLNNGHGGDNLFFGFKINSNFVHDLTVEWYATGVVFSNGEAYYLKMDHHRSVPYSTLWVELDAGSGNNSFASGGSGKRGPHSGAYSTYWNIDARRDMSFPEDEFGPKLNFIGFRSVVETRDSLGPHDWFVENIEPMPVNIWNAMREKRGLSPKLVQPCAPIAD